jgi:hypothetical protein
MPLVVAGTDARGAPTSQSRELAYTVVDRSSEVSVVTTRDARRDVRVYVLKDEI